jgi:adenosylcobinamide-GDP ribazoletransferase
MRAAVSFLTSFGGARSPGPRTLDWFPVVGTAIGLLLGGLWWLAGRAWPAGVAAALVVAADLAVTGLLHFDGLVDSADGLLPAVDRQRRLEIMTSPDIGAFGLGTGGAVLLARWVALASIRPAVLLLGGLWCLSRTAMAAVARTQPYARAGGLASAFRVGPTAGSEAGSEAGSGASMWPLLGGAAVAAGLLLWWRLGPGAAAGGAAVVAVAAVVVLARRRIGGYTGDVLGACGVLAETAGLVVAAARW